MLQSEWLSSSNESDHVQQIKKCHFLIEVLDAVKSHDLSQK